MVTGTDRQPGEKAFPVSKSKRSRILDFIRTLPPNKKALVLNVILLLATVLFFALGMRNLKESYQSTKQSVYEGIYQTAYNMAEARNHVSNYVVISVDRARRFPAWKYSLSAVRSLSSKTQIKPVKLLPGWKSRAQACLQSIYPWANLLLTLSGTMSLFGFQNLC